jgi:methionyl-tRNA formyltransferase
VRAGNPRPGAWTELDGQRFKVLRVALESGDGEPGTVRADGVTAAADGGLRLVEIQPAGKPPMTARAWLAGRRGAPTRFQ